MIWTSSVAAVTLQLISATANLWHAGVSTDAYMIWTSHPAAVALHLISATSDLGLQGSAQTHSPDLQGPPAASGLAALRAPGRVPVELAETGLTPASQQLLERTCTANVGGRQRNEQPGSPQPKPKRPAARAPPPAAAQQKARLQQSGDQAQLASEITLRPQRQPSKRRQPPVHSARRTRSGQSGPSSGSAAARRSQSNEPPSDAVPAILRIASTAPDGAGGGSSGPAIQCAQLPPPLLDQQPNVPPPPPPPQQQKQRRRQRPCPEPSVQRDVKQQPRRRPQKRKAAEAAGVRVSAAARAEADGITQEVLLTCLSRCPFYIIVVSVCYSAGEYSRISTQVHFKPRCTCYRVKA